MLKQRHSLNVQKRSKFYFAKMSQSYNGNVVPSQSRSQSDLATFEMRLIVSDGVKLHRFKHEYNIIRVKGLERRARIGRATTRIFINKL